MGYKKLSKEQELQLVQEYVNGASVKVLMDKYNFKTKKSITDKVKKYYPDTYKDLIEQARLNRKDYSYHLKTINNQFDAYYLGLLLTDGYISRNTDIGIDLIDEDCIAFLSKVIGKEYKAYEQEEGKQTKYRLIFSNKEMVKDLERLGVTSRKSYTVKGPQLTKKEEKFIPYILRGIIDGDGCVSPTSAGSAQFYIVTMSEDFKNWLVDILENRLFMIDIHVRQNEYGLWRIETANQHNVLKLISLVYDKPFGMNRKYTLLRKTFRDYNKDILLEDDGIVQTTTE
mgnify:CR=1 FL=1